MVPPQQPIRNWEIDERWIGEWVALGLREFEALLLHHAQFDRYLVTVYGVHELDAL